MKISVGGTVQILTTIWIFSVFATVRVRVCKLTLRALFQLVMNTY